MHDQAATEQGPATVRRPEAAPRAFDSDRICVLVRPGELPGAADYFAGAFTDRSAAEAVRATLPLVDRVRAEIRELHLDELRPRPQ